MFVAVDALWMTVDEHENRCATLPADEMTGIDPQIIPRVLSVTRNAFAHPECVGRLHPDKLLKNCRNIVNLITRRHCSQSLGYLRDFVGVLLCVC
jgi:hypothetical protein